MNERELQRSVLYELKRDAWTLCVSASADGISFHGGEIGGMRILPSPVFAMRLEYADGTVCEIDSRTGWDTAEVVCEAGVLQMRVCGVSGAHGISVSVTGHPDDRGISFALDVQNHTQDCSVAEITYPVPAFAGEPLHLFLPDCCGRALMNAGETGFDGAYDYPGHNMSMQYFAFWGACGGVYLGVHDPDACMKTIRIHTGDGEGHLRIGFPAIGAGLSGNSFAPAGLMRWEAFCGDWYDAAMLYAAFVRREAVWLPVRGRPDTAQRFRELPYWICDYIPNSPTQLDARPMTLATVSERYGADYWTDAAIALKERLGTPVGYHVYNWHEIPFNINYPHFLPARDIFVEKLKTLQAAGLYVFPYINAVSWEMDDAEEGFAENFENTGSRGAAVRADGTPLYVTYPQKKASGAMTRLAPMCPSFVRWHDIIEETARGLDALGVDGIYFDQIAAVPSFPCRSRGHGHLPGGGSYWSDGYNRMMDTVNAGKPADRFYFTESNAEPYMKSFDGYLTWVWTMGDDVPAFPAVYAGYIQMIGRYTDGAKRDDDAYFRYHLAEGLLFGQQLGWLNANVVYHEERMRFLEQIVQTRYRYSALFADGYLCRPPTVTCDLPPVTSSGITMRQVVAGLWKHETRAVLFVVNVSPGPAHAVLRMNPGEAGIVCDETICMELAPLSVSVTEFALLQEETLCKS